MVPDRRRCLEVLAEEEVPEHIRLHSLLVASVALALGAELAKKGEKLDLKLLEAAALLHDVSKMAAIRDGGNHALMGGERVAQLGFGELAEAVARHVDIGEWDEAGPVTEAELVNYSDKRVKHQEVVSLGDRFDDLVARYGKTQMAVAKIEEHRGVLTAIEKKIFTVLGLAPQELKLS